MTDFLQLVKAQGLCLLRSKKLIGILIAGNLIGFGLSYGPIFIAMIVQRLSPSDELMVIPLAFMWIEILGGVSSIVGFILFVCYGAASLELTKQIFSQDREALHSIRPNGLVHTLLALICFLLSLWLVSLIAIFIFLIVPIALSNPSAVELNISAQAILLRFGGITLIALLLGVLFGRLLKRPLAYASLATIFLLLTPVVDVMLSSRAGLSGFTERLILHWTTVAPFSLVSRILTTSVDTLYLIPVESHRWILPAIWLAAITAGIALSITRLRRFSLAATVLIFALLVTPWAVQGAHIALPNSFESSPQSVFGSLMTDIWEAHDRGQSPDKADDVILIPTVAQYKLDMSIGNMLSGEVTIKLAEPFNRTPVFTLFRGYRIQSITDLEGTNLEFVQNFDHITITTPNQELTTGFIFSYAGSGWGYYANSQGVFLPGTFPWYPWPGKQRFIWRDFHADWEEAELEALESDHFDRRGEVHDIQLRVRSSHSSIYTPHGITIERSQSDDFVTIPAQSASIMAGSLEFAGTDDTFKVITGKGTIDAAIFSDPSRDWALDYSDEQAMQEVVLEAYRLREVLGIDQPNDLNSRTLVIVPTVPRFNNLYEIPRYMDGYILIADGALWNSSLYPVILALQDLSYDFEKRGVFEILYRYLSSPEWFLHDHPAQDDGGSDFFFDEARFLMSYLVTEKDEEYVLRRIADYLRDTDTHMTTLEFFRSLREELTGQQ